MRTYDQKRIHEPMLDTVPAVIVGLSLGVAWLGSYIGHTRYYFSYHQLFELFIYFASIVVGIAVAIWYAATQRSRREEEWTHPPLALSPRKDDRLTRKAWEQ